MLLMLITAGEICAAELQPPLQALRHKNFTLIVAERPDQPVVDSKMHVQVIERLRGDPDVPDQIELLILEGDEQYMQPGERYLVFYSDVERVSFKVRKEVRRPDRRKLLHIDGADPAVYPDTLAMRQLLNPDSANPEQSPRYREIVIQGLRSEDPALVDLWSAEWALRPGTFATVEPGDTEALRGVIDNPLQRPAARARIIDIAAQRVPAEDTQWLVEGAQGVLKQTQVTELSEDAGLSQLIYACLLVVQNHPNASMTLDIQRWLRATPPLAEHAALALRAIDPGLEGDSVAAAINDPKTPEKTRAFLGDHLRRMKLVQAKTP